MLQILSIAVAVLGLVALLVGISRVVNPERYASRLATRSEATMTDLHHRRARSSGAVLCVLGLAIVAIATYNILMTLNIIDPLW